MHQSHMASDLPALTFVLCLQVVLCFPESPARNSLHATMEQQVMFSHKSITSDPYLTGGQL